MSSDLTELPPPNKENLLLEDERADIDAFVSQLQSTIIKLIGSVLLILLLIMVIGQARNHWSRF